MLPATISAFFIKNSIVVTPSLSAASLMVFLPYARSTPSTPLLSLFLISPPPTHAAEGGTR